MGLNVTRMLIAAIAIGTLAPVAIVGIKAGSPSLVAATDSSVTRCPVHRAVLREDTVPILYGYAPAIPEYEWLRGYAEAHAQDFPNTRRWAIGGCSVDFDTLFARVDFCPLCRSAEADWVTAHSLDRTIAFPAVQLPVAPEPAQRGAQSTSNAVAPAR
jgi:hypothetical protein